MLTSQPPVPVIVGPQNSAGFRDCLYKDNHENVRAIRVEHSQQLPTLQDTMSGCTFIALC
jgi:hypothetical protein